MIDTLAAQAEVRVETQSALDPARREALELWKQVTLRSVREGTFDLSNRQLAILLVAATEPGPHTIRSLALNLSISKPAVCRAADALSMLALAERTVDPEDRRNVALVPTAAGLEYLAALGETILRSLV